jgi:hypothetical protein
MLHGACHPSHVGLLRILRILMVPTAYGALSVSSAARCRLHAVTRVIDNYAFPKENTVAAYVVCRTLAAAPFCLPVGAGSIRPHASAARRLLHGVCGTVHLV